MKWTWIPAKKSNIHRNLMGFSYRVLTLCCLSGSNWSLTYGSVAVCVFPLVPFGSSSTTLLYGKPLHRITDTTNALRSVKYLNLNIKEPSLPYSCVSLPSEPIEVVEVSIWPTILVWISFSSVYLGCAIIDWVLRFGDAAWLFRPHCSVVGDREPGNGLLGAVGDGDFFK